MSTLYNRLQATAVDRPDHKAIIGCDGVEVCYQELIERVKQFSLSLFSQLKKDVRPHVAVLMGNSIEQIVVTFALSRLNAVVVPLNPELKDEQVCQALSSTAVGLVIVERGRLLSCGPTVQVLPIETLISLSVEENVDFVIPPWNEGDTFLVTLSSGATGDPKPIMLSEQSKLKRAQQTWSLYDVSADDVVLNASPFFSLTGAAPYLCSLVERGNIGIDGSIYPPALD